MMKPTLFIADLHLSPDDPATAQAFASFIGVCLLAPFRALLWKMAPLRSELR